MDEMIERRVAAGALEVRAEDGAPGRLAGYAAVFNALSDDLGGFREIIAPGAFLGAQEADVRALWNHDSSYVLGRTRNGTLTVAEDDTGLFVQIEPPETQWARDAMQSVRRGDVSQMSFGFVVPPGGDEWEERDGGMVRTLRRVELFDVSPVAFPAYPQTSVAVRDKMQALRAQGLEDESEEAARAALSLRRKRLELVEAE